MGPRSTTWPTVEGCACGGSSSGAYVGRAAARDAGGGARDARGAHPRLAAQGPEAWISTADGTLTGPRVIFRDRPRVEMAPFSRSRRQTGLLPCHEDTDQPRGEAGQQEPHTDDDRGSDTADRLGRHDLR